MTMIKTLFQKLAKDDKGVISVEFALIAPMLIFATLTAINLGYQVSKHQKLASSIAAGNNYLQDYVMKENLNDFRPNFNVDTNQVSDTTPLANAKYVIQSAYGDDLSLDDIFINTECGCPNNSNSGGEQSEPIDFTKPETEYYTRTKMALWKKGELCAFDCPEQGGRARVIVEIEVNHTIKDLLGHEEVIYEVLKSRMR